MNRKMWPALAAVLIVVAAVAALWWWQVGPRAPATSTPSAAPPRVGPPAPAPQAVAPEPELEPPAPRADEPPLPRDDAAVQQALVDLLGRGAVLRLLQTDAFANRVAATVDNLPRQHAAPRLWPVNPTPGRFGVDDEGRALPANAGRYDALLNVALALEPERAAVLYRRLLPQLQTAYEELGYPGRSFHARMVEVLDHLIATDVPREPPRTVLTDVKGPIASDQPWVRYEYADPAMGSASAGRRILWRLGEQRQRRVQDWLRAVRAEIVR
jgi:hypothetical protein